MAVITRYINTASTPGGDGTTNLISGATRAYASATEWEAAEQADLVAAGNIHEVICEGATADASTLDINGWTTGASNYVQMKVEPANRHPGKWSTSHYRIESATPLRVNTNYARFIGLQVKTSTGANETVQSFPDGGEVRVSYAILWNPGGDVIAIRTNPHTLKIWNTVGISDAAASGTVEIFHNEVINVASILWCYNCTAYAANLIRCFYAIGTSVNHLKNCLGKMTGTETPSQKCFEHTGGTFNVNYCASSDASADDYGGTGNRVSQTFTFVDEANDDFHLAAGDVGARGFGTNLSTDPDISFSDDIDGQTRVVPWDIGADQVLVGVSGVSSSGELLRHRIGS